MKPITTDSEMYRVRSPRRKTATRIWIPPAITAKRKVASKASCGVARPTKARALKVTSEMALVGPFIRCADDPKIEATAVTTIAEYSPKRGSIPAIRA